MAPLTREQTAIPAVARDFVRKEIAPHAAEWDRTATVPVPTVRRAGELGLFGVHAAALKETGARCVKEASMAKLFASRMCERACSAAIQVHGGYGFVRDYPVEKLYRDARVFQIYDGTNEVQRILIARERAAGASPAATHEARVLDPASRRAGRAQRRGANG